MPINREQKDRSVPRARVRAGDESIDRRGRLRNTPAVLSYGFRPFFLGASIYAAVAVLVWLWMRASGVEPSGPFVGSAWHAHEMIFGYLGAVMAGFILTAVPNWTGRLPLSGAPLAALVGLWVAGRVASFTVSSPVAALALHSAVASGGRRLWGRFSACRLRARALASGSRCPPSKPL